MADVGDAKQVKDKKTRAQIIRDDEIRDFHRLLKDSAFRAVLWRFLEMCNIYDSAPQVQMERFEGRRDIGLRIMEEIFTVNPEAYTLIRSEAESRKVQSMGSRDPINEGKQ